MLVDTDAAGALTVAERIRTEVEASSANGGQPLTVSIGVASYPDDAAARDELLDKADWAMYAAKRAGRNRVLAFGDGLVARRDLALATGAVGFSAGTRRQLRPASLEASHITRDDVTVLEPLHARAGADAAPTPPNVCDSVRSCGGPRRNGSR